MTSGTFGAMFDKTAGQLFDPYERRARLTPALLTIAPMIVLLMVLYRGDLSVLSLLTSGLVSCGILFLLADTARSRGKEKEVTLWKEWGGMPSMQLLRHSDPTFSRMSTERYHQFLSTRIKVLFFSAADEASDPKGADEIYRSASDYLREVTRNTKKFKLLFADNITYGFRRNALGLKSIGISMCASTIALQLAIVGARFFSAKARDIRSLAASMNGYDWIVLGVAFGLLMMWTLYFTKSNVKSAAYDYAKKLVLACDTLEASAASPKANRGRRAAPRAPT